MRPGTDWPPSCAETDPHPVEGPAETKPTGGVGLLRARFRMTLPEDLWVAEVSTSFPDATFRLLTGVPKGDRAIELGEVLADDPEAAAVAIRDHPDVVAYDRLLADDQRAITQYEAEEQRLYQFLWESSLPPEFPIDVENGAMAFDLTATQAQFEAFGEVLDASGLQYELLTVVHTDDEESLLTERQRECLTVAQRRGYFDVPRECTLAELADALDVDKSTASETIRRGTARVLEQFLVGRK
jgi:predicted DNA binding protein